MATRGEVGDWDLFGRCDDSPVDALKLTEESEAFRVTLQMASAPFWNIGVGGRQARDVCCYAQEKHGFRPNCGLLRETPPLYGTAVVLKQEKCQRR